MVENQQKHAIGVFPSRQQAEQALNKVKTSGFPMDKVSIIAKQAEQDGELGSAKTSDHIGDKDVGSATGVVADALTGSTWGTILVGLTGLALPGIGPIITAGSLGAALVTTLAGVGLGVAENRGLVKALKDLGIPEERATAYSDCLLRGDYLVIVDGIEDEISRVAPILSDQGIQEWGIYNAAKDENE